MSQMRQNKLTGQWVIYAPERSDRPSDFDKSKDVETLQRYDEDCPFCIGNEEQLPEIILDLGDGVRVVPNKYPTLRPEAERKRYSAGLYVQMGGYGHHEVIIESTRHDHDLPDMSQEQVEAIIESYHRRYVDLMRHDRNMMVIIFRNHGESAGTSIQHPHSQLVGTGVVPKHIRWRDDIAQRYFDTWGRALLQDIVIYEKEVQTRIISENESFLSIVPYAAEVPAEIWIIPKRLQADFGAIKDHEKKDLAHALRDCLGRLKIAHNDPDYNYVIHTAPQYKADEPHLCWYLEIRPRLVTRAGFEIGSGMVVNPSLPEDDVQLLRDIGQ